MESVNIHIDIRISISGAIVHYIIHPMAGRIGRVGDISTHEISPTSSTSAHCQRHHGLYESGKCHHGDCNIKNQHGGLNQSLGTITRNTLTYSFRQENIRDATGNYSQSRPQSKV